MSSWLHDPEQRRLLTAQLHEKHRRAKQKQETQDASAEQQRIDDVWIDAISKGDGEVVRVCWLDLKHVSDRVYAIPNLQELVLDGIGLPSLEGISEHNTSLQHLSLASNRIEDVTGIHRLVRLVHLNLLRNSLTSLPPNIGDLENLTRLDLANNRITELPDGIGRLARLKIINLESNELSELPKSFGKLSCDKVNLNCNNFAVFPDCLLYLKRLSQLSIMSNQLINLPLGMRKLTCLKSLRASKNKINILPDSLVDVATLEVLWLDFNRLAALPPNFHRLRKLKVLKLDGNVDLVYPPLDTVIMGTEEVLRWSRLRLETKKTAKLRQIVQGLEEVLTLVDRHKIGGGLHESLFRISNDDCYQFPPDALWNVFIPELRKMWSEQDASGNSNDGIKSFNFERNEVEQALFEWRDAAGALCRHLPNARFRRCSCVKTGRERVCVPPKLPWMCIRPALLVRRKVAYEEDMIERRRLLEEDTRVAEASKAAEALAREFLASDEGVISVREEAERRLAMSKQLSRKSIARSSSTTSINERIVSSLRLQFGDQHKKELRQIEQQIRAEYLDNKIHAKEYEIREGNKKVRVIMKEWLGVTSDQVFRSWREIVDASKKLQRREERQRLREERLAWEDRMAAFELQKSELSDWVKQFDAFNDMPCWINMATNEVRYERPTPPLRPLMPESMINAATGKAKSRDEIMLDEADSLSSEEDHDSSSRNDDDSLSSENDNDSSSREDVNNSDVGSAGDDAESSRIYERQGAPVGLDAEYELAKKRVLEMLMKRNVMSAEHNSD